MNSPSRPWFGFAFLALVAWSLPADEEPVLGGGEHRYRWVEDWPQLPADVQLGNTHGAIVVDGAGRIYANTDSERAVCVFSPDGELVDSFGRDLAGGLHGMTIVATDEGEELVLCHQVHGVLGTSLSGEVKWRLDCPRESEKYAEGQTWRPTSVAVAPNGDLFVADGYGLSWVHQFDAERNYVRSIGGPGQEPGQFRTPHGLAIDPRGEEPTLLVADRENGRLQRFTLAGEHVEVLAADALRRPCSVAIAGDDAVIADLNGRVTILVGEDAKPLQLGDNPDKSKWAQNGVPRDQWRDGHFLAPHGAAWDAAGDLYVMDWNANGRLTKLERIDG